jgi:hypothetical protein
VHSSLFRYYRHVIAGGLIFHDGGLFQPDTASPLVLRGGASNGALLPQLVNSVILAGMVDIHGRWAGTPNWYGRLKDDRTHQRQSHGRGGEKPSAGIAELRDSPLM